MTNQPLKFHALLPMLLCGLLLLTAGFIYGTRNVDWYASETRSGDGGTADQEEFNHA